MTTPATLKVERRGPITPHHDVAHSRNVWVEFRKQAGYTGYAPLLTAPENQAKLGLNNTPTYCITLSAGREEGMCVNDHLCKAICVVDNHRYHTVKQARRIRTEFLLLHPEHFAALVLDELQHAIRKHGRIGFRPNANSDVAWERILPDMFELLAKHDCFAYDYTKRRDRVGLLLPNYRVILSITGQTSHDAVTRLLETGNNVAAIFAVRKDEPLPQWWNGFRIIDGDVTDDRYNEPTGVIVGLRAKGLLRNKPQHPMVWQNVDPLVALLSA